MNIKSSIIRRIEEKDKGAYLRLFNDENFGCIGINSNLKPSIYEEERIVSKIIDPDTEEIEYESTTEECP